ncbi:Per1-like [Spirosomataceae bacterium TFI 002]|nr:Per1-like [Spirosomataceae bacterium TFI 002]
MDQRIIIKSAIFTATMWLFWLLANSLLPPTIWEGMQLSKSALTVEYCEFNNPKQFFHQSINTYSNLAYFFFGSIILFTGIADKRRMGNFLSNFSWLSIITGACMIYLSFGSAFFHASLTWIGQRVDMNGTYGITIVLAVIGFVHLFKAQFQSSISQKWLSFGLLAFILAFYEIALHVSSGVVVPVLILASLIFMLVEYFKNRSKKSILLISLSMIIIVVAVKVRSWDVQKIGCDPLSYFQGHSLWHLLTAMSSFVTYSFYRLDFE